MKHMMIWIAMAALAAIGDAGVAAAQGTETVKVPVRAGDLNLRNSEGQATLNRRLNQAASTACSQSDNSLAAASEARRCRRDALASARAQGAALAVRQEETARAERRATATRSIVRLRHGRASYPTRPSVKPRPARSHPVARLRHGSAKRPPHHRVGRRHATARHRHGHATS